MVSQLMAQPLHSYGTLLGSWERPDEGIEILGQELAIRRRFGDSERLVTPCVLAGTAELEPLCLSTGIRFRDRDMKKSM